MVLFLKKYIHLIAVLSIAGQGLLYMLIAQTIPGEPFFNYFWIDTQIPYLSWFVLPYVSWMPVLYLGFIYLGLTNRSLYWRTIITYNAAVMISNIIFIFFPTYVPRPDISGNDIFTLLVQFIYTNDEPLNCFPSIHCLTSYLLLITMTRHKLLSIGLRIAFATLFWLIIASTVFIKQHALIDVFGGILVAEGVYRIVHYAASRQVHRRKQSEPATLSNN